MQHCTPHVIQSVQIASRRAAADAHNQMKRGLASLALISATAPLVGFFGTILGLLNSFPSYGTSKSMIISTTAGRLSEALAPTLLALWVAVPAFWFHKYLSGRLETFDLEMENASADLVNRVVVQLERLSAAGKIRLALPTRHPQMEGSVFDAVEVPNLNLGRIYRNGLLQLVWPRFDSQFDADSVLHGGMLASLAYGLLAWLTYYFQGRQTAGAIALTFFAVAAVNLRTGSLGGVYTLLAYLAFTSLACVIRFGWTLSAMLLMAGPILLLGSAKAARLLRSNRTLAAGFSDAGWHVRVKEYWISFQPFPSILLGLLGVCATTAVLFGTVLTFYSMDIDDSMEPGLHRGDWVVSIHAPFAAPIRHGDIVTQSYWNSFEMARVVGVPGDRIQVRSGKLIRNGELVPEPYCRAPSRGDMGDFPMPLDLLPLIGSSPYVYRPSFSREIASRGRTDYVLPEHAYFVLHDNRNELGDSRDFGPVWDFNITVKPLLAYEPAKVWSVPRLIH